MSATAEKAAALWGLDPARLTLVAARENAVWKAEGEGGPYALRLHRPGYRAEAELLSELQWMQALAEGGLTVPRPHPSRAGRLVELVDGTAVDLLSWMPGRMVGKNGALDGIADRAGHLRQLGALLARLHDLSDAWTPPEGFSRPRWDRAGLLGHSPLWGRFWDNPFLTPGQRHVLLRARAKANAELADLAPVADFGLIHADAITENVMLDGDDLILIDFDDGGWGFRDFDLATVLLRQVKAPDYPALRAALLEGYAVRRRVDPQSLELLLLCRSFTYIGWIMDRMLEPGAQMRVTRAVETAVPLANQYLGGIYD